jgi:carboxymethylenebutenolidase
MKALVAILGLTVSAAMELTAGTPAFDLTRAGLPSEQSAKAVLSAGLAHRHPQYLDLPAGRATVRSFVVFPERGDRSPVVVITADNQGMSDWLRAVGDDAAAQGFIAVVPDLPPGAASSSRAGQVVHEAIAMPASNGHGASVRFAFENGRGRIDVAIASGVGVGDRSQRSASFELGDHAWHNALAFLGQLDTAARSSGPSASAKAPADTSGAPPANAQQPGRGGAGSSPAGRGGTEAPGGMRSKRADLPANFLMAAKTVAESPRKGEWVDIPMAGGTVAASSKATKLRTWISYPQTTGRAPVVLVFQPGPGMDMGEPPTRGGGANWLRGIADQLASEGFIAVLPDLTSGLGPNGGNFDSFQYPDDSAAAIGRIPHAEVLARIRVARDYALRLPMANGRLGATGFCMGGGLAWEAAAEIEGLDAAVVFYGAPPPEPVMTRIKAPVAAFFGANDLGLAPRIAPATADMKRLGKHFDVHVYDEATHVFLYRQDLGRNQQATEDAWPRAIAFFKQHLMQRAS